MKNYNELLKINAFENISFDPEKRNEAFLADAVSEAAKIENICKKANISAERFIEKHYALCEKYLYSQSRCASSAITGSGNFPAATMQKRVEFAHNHLSRLLYFCNNIERIIEKITRKEEKPEEKKAALEKELSAAKKWQEDIKKVNKLLKAGKRAEAVALLGSEQELLENKRFWQVEFFPTFSLTNNLARIKRLEILLKNMDRTQQQYGFSFDGGKVEHNNEELRWNIFFNEKPSEEKRANLKRHGFKWSPSRNAWTRSSLTMPQSKLQALLF